MWSGLPTIQVTLELALAVHYAVQNTHHLNDTINRLRTLTDNGDYTYHTELAAFTGNLPHRLTAPAHWLDGEPTTRARWHALVTTRRKYLVITTCPP